VVDRTLRLSCLDAAEDRDRAVAQRGVVLVGSLTNKVRRAGEPVALNSNALRGPPSAPKNHAAKN
jgi:hypothetical protein